VTLLLGPLVLSGGACASPNRDAAEVVSRTDDWSQADDLSQSDELSPSGELSQPDVPTRQDNGSQLNRSGLRLQSASALVVDEHGNRLYAKNAQQIRPIASVSKLMTAMVVLDAGVPLNTPISIIEDDRDRLRNSRSRLRIGEATLPRSEMMMAALVSSDNRAAHALGRTTFRGGTPAFIKAMNRKARSLGMFDTYFEDSTGLNEHNRSSAEDLVKMVRAASTYPFIRKATSTGEMTLYPFANRSPLQYRNTNPLVRDSDWQVEVSKTGFINEAGHCLVMQTRIADQRVYLVLLDSVGKQTPVGDANRVRNWILAGQQTAAR
jgi:D-alanyl-D-alanine endopeptidase (penicillin-binding protein 7)